MHVSAGDHDKGSDYYPDKATAEVGGCSFRVNFQPRYAIAFVRVWSIHRLTEICKQRAVKKRRAMRDMPTCKKWCFWFHGPHFNVFPISSHSISPPSLCVCFSPSPLPPPPLSLSLSPLSLSPTFSSLTRAFHEDYKNLAQSSVSKRMDGFRGRVSRCGEVMVS
jgi:hypothetical protein